MINKVTYQQEPDLFDDIVEYSMVPVVSYQKYEPIISKERGDSI